MKALYAQYVQLFIRTPTDTVVTLNDIDTQTKILHLKSRLELHTGIIAETQTLLFNDARLENDQTLEESCIRKNAFLRLRLKENSLEEIYVNAVHGKTKEIFKLGVELIQRENDELDHFDAWNMFVPVRAFQAIFAASFANQLESVAQLLSRGATNIDMVTQNGRSLLHVASFQGHLMCVNFLLAQGVDARLEDKHGKTALSLAAENGQAKVEKRIWLYLWNMDVLDELKLTKRNEHKDKEVEELKQEAQRCREMYDNTRLPVIEVTSKSLLRTKDTTAKSEATTPLPDLRIENRNESGSETAKDGKISEKKLEKLIELDDGTPTRKETSEAREKKKRVCAWLKGNTREASKEPLKNIIHLPTATQLIQGEKPARCGDVTAFTASEAKKDNTVVEKSEGGKKDDGENKAKPSTCSAVFLSPPLGNFVVEPDESCGKKEVIKTDFIRVSKSKTDAEVEEQRQEAPERTPVDNINEDKCSSCQQISSPVMAATDGDVNEVWDAAGDSITINSLCWNEEEENAEIARERSEFWRPESSLFSTTSEFCRRYAKTYDEWLKEKKKSKKEGRRRKNSTVSNENDLTDDKMEKNEEAFRRWVMQKMKERRVSRAESHNQKASSESRAERFGIAFEEWLKSKESTRSIKLTDESDQGKKIINRQIVKGISFDEWKTLKIKEEKTYKSMTETRTELDTKIKTGITFEQWLQDKSEQRKHRIQLEEMLKSQEERRASFMIRFRFDDPRQRTFEEWYWEKEGQLALERRQRRQLTAEKLRKQKKYPEDASLIFDMWLAQKFKSDIESERKMLEESSRMKNGKNSLEAINETDDSSTDSSS